jgi:hypothetical protein
MKWYDWAVIGFGVAFFLYVVVVMIVFWEDLMDMD